MLKKMVTVEGFEQVFWAVLKNKRRAGEKTSQRKVFEELNQLYLLEYGVLRYSDFKSFSNARDFRFKRHRNRNCNSK